MIGRRTSPQVNANARNYSRLRGTRHSWRCVSHLGARHRSFSRQAGNTRECRSKWSQRRSQKFRSVTGNIRTVPRPLVTCVEPWKGRGGKGKRREPQGPFEFQNQELFEEPGEFRRMGRDTNRGEGVFPSSFLLKCSRPWKQSRTLVHPVPSVVFFLHPECRFTFPD